MSSNNVSNQRLLKMISGLQNRLNRLERRTNVGAFAQYTSDTTQVYVGGNVEQQILFEQVIYADGIFYDPVAYHWTCASDGLYMVSMNIALETSINELITRIRVKRPEDAGFVTTNTIISSMATARAVFTFNSAIYLREGDEFDVTISTGALNNIIARNFGAGPPSPVITIAQLTGGFEPATGYNDWYTEEPR